MKNAILLRVGKRSVAARWFGLLAIAVLLLVAVSLKAQTPTITETIVTTLGGGPQYYNPGSNSGSSNSVYGTLNSQFHTPSGLAYDSFQDYLYVADRDNNAIRLIDHSANPSEIFTFAPDPPYVPANLISQPVGVAVDAFSDVFVLNRGKGTNGTVVEFDYLGNLIATNMTRLTNASGIALDTIGNIYVTTSNTVFKITPAGVSNVVVTITNAGTFLQGIVVKRSGPNAGKLAVCDSGRNGIYLINPTSGAVTTNAGFNGAGDGTGNRNQGVLNANARFFQPSGIAEAGDGSLIVTDFGNHRVKVVTAAGLTTNLYGVASIYWWTGTTPTGGKAYLGWSDGAVWEPDGGLGNVQARMPFGVAIGSDGTVYTTEDYYHIIRKVTGANIVPPPPFPPPPPLPLFNLPNGIALDNANANLFIADQSNNVVEQLNLGNNQTTTYLNTNNGVSRPVDVAFDSAGHLFILNQGTGGNGSILEFDQFKNLLATNAAGLAMPTAFTLDNSGNIFVAEQNGLVQEYTPASNTVATVTTAGVQLQGIAIFDDGTIVVSDAGNHVIWQINPVTKVVSLFSGAVGVPGNQLGSTNFARFNQPHKMVRAAGNLAIVADDGNNRLVVMDRTGAVTDALVTTNSEVWFGRSGDPVQPSDFRFVQMISPVGVALDNAGAVYSSETFYDDIRKTPNTGLIQYSSTTTITNVIQTTNGPVTNIVLSVPPTITPNSGYYPMGQTITVVSPNPVYYTTDGSIPTINSTPVTLVANTGIIRWFNTTNDLTSLHVKAFDATNSSITSVMVTGLSVITNTIGTPPDFNPSIQAGIGSSIVIPIVCNLNSNSQVESFQFRYEIAPINNPNTPVMVPLNIIPTNDFVPLVTAAQSGFVATNTLVPYTHGTTNGLTIYAVGAGTHILFQHFAVIAMLDVQIPPNANPGDTYSLNVLYPSATADSYSQNVPLTPMAQATITVSNILYTVGDSAGGLGSWYNAGTFGDNNLDNSDVNQAFYAASGLRVPYDFSDVFNAMDAYPVDTLGNPGGDGQIRFLDWNTILLRSLRLDPNDWAREWSPGGNLVDVMTNLVIPAYSSKQSAAKNSPAAWPWYKQALVGGISVGNASPGSSVSVPVYAKLQYGSTLAGLQFRALVTPQNNAPAITNAPQFNPAGGVASPSIQKSFKAGETAFGWSLLPAPSFNYQSDSSNFLGWVSFTIPSTAQSGQIYTVSFANADGAPNMNTQYDFETRSAYVTVNGAAIPASITSDEWKIYFFGSVTNPLAADAADPDGDGIPNWMEYLAGTDPTTPDSKLQFSGLTKSKGQSQASIQWLTAPGKAYELQWCTNLTGGAWNTLTTVTGNGAVTNCVDTNAASTPRFYRLQLLP